MTNTTVRGHDRPDGRRPLLFIHVPKAAGTTLSALLRSFFHGDEVCPAYYMNELLVLPPEEVRGYSLVAGHFEYSVTDLLDDPLCMTMLRDPISRVQSYYWFIRSSAHHPLHEKFHAMDLADVLGDPQESVPISDHQVRLFGRSLNLEVRRRALLGEEPVLGAGGGVEPNQTLSLDLARARLEGLAFVGLTERFNQSLQLLCFTFGWPLPERYAMMNVTPRPTKPPEEHDVLRELIRSANLLDHELYQRAIEIFEARYAAMRATIAELKGIPEASLDDAMLDEYLTSLDCRRSLDELSGVQDSPTTTT